jgi:arogenate dehydrogenase (NADP+)
MKIGIVGLGLIGGSLAMDFRARGHVIFGVSRQPTTCEHAIAQGIVQDASPEFQVLKEAEVVFLCPPLGSIVQTTQGLIPYLKPTAILTDVGSVKAPIVAAIAPLWPNFIGGHPMAGKAEQGLAAAQPDLFVDRPYVLTPIASTPTQAQETVAGLVNELRSRLYVCQPEDHDQAVAWISHLPVMVSASLITACQSEENPRILELAQALASSGFRDTSRVGGGNPELGRMMAEYNRTALLNSLQRYRDRLNELTQLIENHEWSKLEALLVETQTDRERFSL